MSAPIPPSRVMQKRARVSILSQLMRERLTRPGQYAIVGASATGIAVGFPEQMAGTLGFSVFLSLILVAAVVAGLFRPRVAVRRSIADRCMAGATVPMTITLRNASKTPILDIGAYEFRLPNPLRLMQHIAYVDRIDAGRSHTFEYSIYAPQRGHYALPGATALSAYPFGLMHAKRHNPQRQHLVVYPAFQPMQRVHLNAGLRYQPGGVAMVSQVGESMEFMGNREYRAGDRVRDLHPRSWARVGYPVVRQFEQEFLTRIALVVDTYLPWNWNVRMRRTQPGLSHFMETQFIVGYDQELLEANLSLSAAVADCLAREEYLVDLFAAGPQLYHFQAGRSLAHLEDILDILACIERSSVDPLNVVAPKFCEQLRQTSTVIAILIHWDENRSRFIQNLRMQGVQVKVILLSDDRAQAEMAIQAGASHVTVGQVQAGLEEV